eukprot:CAMPEP_0185734124 /NCGR_PEP_ID=MMETSP1171-20130828/21503_1 /TAXON_ID=374046 /ORGANISM="Helicotheca tamensis, Strain CCMP826" /LENGTH=633 /DNA_ID=CAMNT_0028404037 /DNA_START=30 /DNA_END=1931 /DNA_ORIENTATION=-
MGNAEPTGSALGGWVPNDGDLSSMLEKTLYPVPKEIVPEDSPSKGAITFGNVPDDAGKLDLIVLGMQESTFEVEGKKKNKTLVRQNSEAMDANDDAGESAGTLRDSVIKEKKKKKKKNPIKKAVSSVTGGVRTLTGSRDNTKETFAVPDIRFPGVEKGKEDNEPSILTPFQDTHVLHRLLKERCPSYSIVVDYLRGEMRMIVLVRTELKDQVTGIEVDAENTGLGRVFANKGGIISTLTLRKTRFSFMSAHLTAHEGGKHYINRNKDLAEILWGAKVGPMSKYFDASINSHHAFFCGDLNYRVVLPNADNMEGAEHRETVRGMVEREEWRALNDADELGQALRKKECLNGFVTLPCLFPPTFKVMRQGGYEYIEKRTPSYTDRVLWRSADGFESNISPICYEPCPDFDTSDHKPVRCAFTVKPTKIGNVALENTSATGRKLYAVVSKLSCTDLTIMDNELLGGSSDPYVMFMCLTGDGESKKLLWRNSGENGKSKKVGWPRTKTIMQELNPTWRDPVLLEFGGVASYDDLAGSIVYANVIDYDMNSGDDVIGAVPINLQRICSKISPDDTDDGSRPTQKTQISKPVLRNGQVHGHLTCTIETAWVTQQEFEESVASAIGASKRKKDKSGCLIM